MARPHKQTVAYFPHDTDASDGRTLTIIQSKYGNDGYSFWFKLLQLLGKTPGHYYDFNKPSNLEFLCAKTHQKDTETVLSILETLAMLDAIDAELYAHGVIWCQRFVDGVADAYGRTVSGAPQRPGFLAGDKGISVPDNNVSANRNSGNATEIPQTKLKEIKLKEKKKATAPASLELEIIRLLTELKGWRYDEADDLTWLREFTQEFPDFDLGQLKLARDYYAGKPVPKHKGAWRKRLRNWMLKKPEFEPKEKPGPRGKSFEQYRREQGEGS